jgi:hypothetical protein
MRLGCACWCGPITTTSTLGTTTRRRYRVPALPANGVDWITGSRRFLQVYAGRFHEMECLVDGQSGRTASPAIWALVAKPQRAQVESTTTTRGAAATSDLTLRRIPWRCDSTTASPGASLEAMSWEVGSLARHQRLFAGSARG